MQDLAVIGAGAIAQQAYLPAIADLPSARVRWVVDVDEQRAKETAEQFDALGYATDDRAILEAVDGAVIATPPRFHADIAERCLKAGVHVLTEKPIATSSERGEELVALGESAGVHYAISRQIRESPASRVVRSFIRKGAIGNVESFTMRYGDETHWAFASDYRLRASLAWGGVLTDKAPHALDVLLWTFGTPVEIDRYRDDSFGGLEANAEIELTFPEQGVKGHLEVTADRDLPNEMRIKGTQGRLVANPKAATAHLYDAGGEETVLRPAGSEAMGRYLPRVGKQLQRFVEALETDNATYVPAAEGLTLVECIEQCYEQRERLEHPWEEHRLREEVHV